MLNGEPLHRDEPDFEPGANQRIAVPLEFVFTALAMALGVVVLVRALLF
ncbi:MAG: hypothetical protein JO060_00435 [Candidatus Eremiobacteraeota bacterium]|nr:hypothetical protein [Candidatus Eremiobacteraeota bacterium]MBV9648161.1 hypothetical protein [Candidatus Eremiobacteraeota bacterium]